MKKSFILVIILISTACSQLNPYYSIKDDFKFIEEREFPYYDYSLWESKDSYLVEIGALSKEKDFSMGMAESGLREILKDLDFMKIILNKEESSKENKISKMNGLFRSEIIIIFKKD